jgi:hypothetical protein
MKLCLPTIGSRLILEESWSPIIENEYRNQKFLLESTGIKYTTNYSSGRYQRVYSPSREVQVRIPRGTELVVNRIYIRKRANDFDSYTFVIPNDKPEGFGRQQRFWVKLEEVNKMVAS